MSFPSNWWAGYERTFSTLPGLLNVMKPNPLDRLVAGSFITITSATSPNWEKYSRTLSGVVCQDNPPMNIFPGSLGISSPEPRPVLLLMTLRPMVGMVRPAWEPYRLVISPSWAMVISLIKKANKQTRG